MKSTEILNICLPDTQQSMNIPIAESTIAAGFPSPAEEFAQHKIDLNKELIKNPSATFFARVSGLSMIDEGIDDGDLLVIDKSITPYDHCLSVCFIDGEFTLKRFLRQGEKGLLMPANKNFKPIEVSESNAFMIWGVVRYVIKKC